MKLLKLDLSEELSYQIKVKKDHECDETFKASIGQFSTLVAAVALGRHQRGGSIPSRSDDRLAERSDDLVSIQKAWFVSHTEDISVLEQISLCVERSTRRVVANETHLSVEKGHECYWQPVFCRLFKSVDKINLQFYLSRRSEYADVCSFCLWSCCLYEVFSVTFTGFASSSCFYVDVKVPQAQMKPAPCSVQPLCNSALHRDQIKPQPKLCREERVKRPKKTFYIEGEWILKSFVFSFFSFRSVTRSIRVTEWRVCFSERWIPCDLWEGHKVL